MYKFELENVLEVRKHIEDSIKSEIGAIEHAIRVEENAIHETLHKKDKIAQNFEKKCEKGATSGEYLLFSGFMDKINQNIKSRMIGLRETEDQRDHKRGELLLAVKNRKALEKLKEKRAAEYKLKQEKIEMNNLDDFSSIQHLRQMESN